MSANTLSPLSRGYGSWTAGYVDPYFGGKGAEENNNKLHKEVSFPEIEHHSHIHGVTVGSRSGHSTSMSWAASHRSREPTSDGIPLPKTLTTRTGALQIYVAPDDLPDEDSDDGLELKPKYVQIKRPSGQELIDLSLKLGTMERLAISVLQFGDQEYDHEHTSITDTKNKSFLKFMHSIDNEAEPAYQPDVDRTVQPGGDLNHYLRDLRSSASSRFHSDGSTYLPKSRESQELQALLRGLDNSGWPMSYPSSQDGHSSRQFTQPVSRVSSRGPSPRPPSTPRSVFQVLSAKKVAASVKSGGYLGRPGSQVSVSDSEIRDTSGSPSHVTSATIVRRQWTPENSTDSVLFDARTSFFYGPDENGDTDENKRARELSFYSGLYPVDEERLSEIKSFRSSRKGRSVKKSKSGVSDTGDIAEDDSSSGEFKLPSLASDRWLEDKDAHAIVAELDALGLLGKTDDKTKKGLTFPLATGKRPKAPAEKTKIPDHMAEALKHQPLASINKLEQDLERMTDLVTESLSGPTLEAIGEGLTEEEFELAKALLMKKLDEAKGKLDNKDSTKSSKKKPSSKKGGKKGKKKGSSLEEKSDEDLEREAIRAKHEEEKKKRDEEAADLQRQIAEKRKLLQGQTDLTSSQSRELREKMAELERQAEDLMRAEDEARSMLAEVRRKQREEREARRRADLERKRQEALERREREKRDMEERKKREEEMIQKMEDIEMRRRMREEEERRAYEEERLAQERYELDMQEAAKHEEEEEERLKEMERQAEEEAMARLIEEREEAERQRRKLREEEDLLREEEERKKSEMLAEQQRLEMERQKILEAENAKREAEKRRLLELRRLEEEARQRMLDEIEQRRMNAIERRDYNIDNRNNMDKLKHYQEITRAWTFSYFVHWPRETYERPIGDPDPRKVVKIKNPPPKKVEPAPAEGDKGQKVAPPNPT